MLDKIKDFLRVKKDNVAPMAQAVVDTGDTRLATAVVLLEVCISDSRLEPVEQQRLIAVLQRLYNCSAGDAAQLMQDAVAQSEDKDHFYTFAKTVKDKMSYDDRVHIIELMWEIAYSDGEMHNFEENLIRRAAGLLYVTDKDRAEARQRVLNRLG